MGKLACWLGLHSWQCIDYREERVIIDLLGNRPLVTFRVYRCTRCSKGKEEMEL